MTSEKIFIDKDTEKRILERAGIVDTLRYLGHSINTLSKPYSTNCCLHTHQSTNDLKIYPKLNWCRCWRDDKPLRPVNIVMSELGCSYYEALVFLAPVANVILNGSNPKKPHKKKIMELRATPIIKPLLVIDEEVVKRSLSEKSRLLANVLFSYISSIFGEIKANQIFDTYRVGTSKDGRAVFWQIDEYGNARDCNVLKYQHTGHRDKSVDPWTPYAKDKFKDMVKVQCMFGQHLIASESCNVICVVESEKTAIACQLYTQNLLPNCLWLGVSGMSRLDKLETALDTIRQRQIRIALFPDANGVTQWTNKAKALKEKGYSVDVWQYWNVNNIGEECGDDIWDILEPFAKSGVKAEELITINPSILSILLPTIAEAPQISTTAPKVDNLPPKAQTTKLEPKESEIRQYPYFERLVEADEPLRPNRQDLPVECPF